MDSAVIGVEAGIAATFGADHAWMRDRLARAIGACRRAEVTAARAAFDAYAARLGRHILVEDGALFSAFEAHTNLRVAGPTVVMRREHRQIERRLARLHDALRGAPRLDDVAAELEALQAMLADHDRREENVLYPACDRILTIAEREACADVLTHEELR
jgi:iron-sulfur cluster repair protein YtfE (RIC family)